ncbi:MAG: TetR/AcrR family transcriptional regulator [Planctomycetes bacterium]|nr:TetR/AcrR family transcriptional regulator [Planctomycetota bacterium]
MPSVRTSAPRGARLPARERRAVTLDRAMALFARRGFSGTRTPDLARACGVSEAMLFKLFATKRDLYRALVRRKMEEAGEGVFPRDAAERGDDEAFFLAVTRSLLENTAGRPHFMRLLLFSALEGNELADLFYEARSRKVVDFVSGYIRRRIRQGCFRSVAPDLAALAFLGMVFQYALATRVFGMRRFAAHSREAYARVVVSVFLGGMKR